MQLNQEIFPSKVLLFGEYSIIVGSLGIAVPFSKYSGSLVLTDQENPYRDEFKDFYKYLKNLNTLASELDLECFLKDIDQNLSFVSNIPKGAGVGSSGAICAALYSRYVKDKSNISEDEYGLKKLIDRMALMESFYHGSSSGLDPMVSLANESLIVENRNNIKIAPNKTLLSHFLIFDTCLTRKTAPLVHLFLEKLENKNFKKELDRFVEMNDAAINSYLINDKVKLDQLAYEISKWQYVNLSEMIVPEVRDVWLEGIESKEFFVKLCGAGGGGHYLVYDVNHNLKGKLRQFKTLTLM